MLWATPSTYFNSRPSARGDGRQLQTSRRQLQFQFTPLREGRRRKMNEHKNRVLFQFTPLREGRHRKIDAMHREYGFQFTPLREGRHKVKSGTTAPSAFQFTPLREGRLYVSCGCFNGSIISIHAPPRGATISLSALPVRLAHFNSRPSARGDLEVAQEKRAYKRFQFTPLREGRHSASQQCRASALFQFTPLREGRRELRASRGNVHEHFNSRPSARGDHIRTLERGKRLISIHAPPRGATGDFADDPDSLYISIHAPPRGATPPQ